jgi:hypothetical protein
MVIAVCFYSSSAKPICPNALSEKVGIMALSERMLFFVEIYAISLMTTAMKQSSGTHADDFR